MGTLRRGSNELVELVDLDTPPETSTIDRLSPDSALAGFETFYRNEFAGLVVLARVLAGPALAEDVAQEAMLVACRKWNTVQDYESPVGWVRTVCMHKAVSMVRRRNVERRIMSQLGAFRAQDEPVAGEDERFWHAVRSLPLRQAQVVALHYALDLSVVEVARTLDCAEGTVKAHLSRARCALASTLGVPEEER